jgi:hypothetical protein
MEGIQESSNVAPVFFRHHGLHATLVKETVRGDVEMCKEEMPSSCFVAI